MRRDPRAREARGPAPRARRGDHQGRPRVPPAAGLQAQEVHVQDLHPRQRVPRLQLHRPHHRAARQHAEAHAGGDQHAHRDPRQGLRQGGRVGAVDVRLRRGRRAARARDGRHAGRGARAGAAALYVLGGGAAGRAAFWESRCSWAAAGCSPRSAKRPAPSNRPPKTAPPLNPSPSPSPLLNARRARSTARAP